MPEVKGVRPEKGKSRLKQKEGLDIPLPEVGLGSHLIDYFFKVGMVASNGMGVEPISFTEIDVWSRRCGYALDNWECEVLHELSVSYAAELSNSKDIAAPAPWGEIPGEDTREKIAAKVSNIFK